MTLTRPGGKSCHIPPSLPPVRICSILAPPPTGRVDAVRYVRTMSPLLLLWIFQSCAADAMGSAGQFPLPIDHQVMEPHGPTASKSGFFNRFGPGGGVYGGHE